jgi:hypothetical protein
VDLSGPSYTAVRVTNLRITEDGAISFVVPPRKLFGQRPVTFEEAERMTGYGFTSSELRMQGSLVDGVLAIRCSAD